MEEYIVISVRVSVPLDEIQNNAEERVTLISILNPVSVIDPVVALNITDALLTLYVTSVDEESEERVSVSPSREMGEDSFVWVPSNRRISNGEEERVRSAFNPSFTVVYR